MVALSGTWGSSRLTGCLCKVVGGETASFVRQPFGISQLLLRFRGGLGFEHRKVNSDDDQYGRSSGIRGSSDAGGVCGEGCGVGRSGEGCG